jgi:acyl carrier protein
MTTDEAIRRRVAAIVRVVFGVESPRTVALAEPAGEWDSLRHIEILLAVEEEFDISISEADFASLRSIDSISAHIADVRAAD